MSELTERVIELIDEDRYYTYASLAAATGETKQRVKHAVSVLRKGGDVRVEYVEMNGCIRKAVVMKNDDRMLKKDEQALAGAYKMGQTDLDGGMIIGVSENFVRKGKAPWKTS